MSESRAKFATSLSVNHKANSSAADCGESDPWMMFLPIATAKSPRIDPVHKNWIEIKKRCCLCCYICGYSLFCLGFFFFKKETYLEQHPLGWLLRPIDVLRRWLRFLPKPLQRLVLMRSIQPKMGRKASLTNLLESFVFWLNWLFMFCF